jgi:hypothetical protein
MNTKNIIAKLLLGIFLTVGFASCEIEEYNPSGTTAENVWATSDGIETLINSAYRWQRKVFYNTYGFVTMEMGVDIWESNSWRQLTQYEGLQPDNDSSCGALWQYCYEGINMCNIGIKYIEDGITSYNDDELKKQHLAEFKFMRGFYYWFIVETWGEAILKTEPTNSPILTAKRSTAAEFYEVILADLQYAAENATLEEVQPGRVTQKGALGILARAALSASYQVDEKKNEYLNLAKSTADELIDNASSYGVELYDDFADVWDEDNNKNNAEALYRVTFSEYDYNNDSYGNSWWTMYKFNYSQSDDIHLSYEYGYRDKDWGNPNFTYPSKYLFDVFDTSVDSRFEKSFRTLWRSNINDPIDEPATGDTALFVSISSDPKPNPGKDYRYLNIDSIYNADGSVKAYSNPFPALKKFDSPKYNGYYKKTRYGLLDKFVMRLSEVYLIAAEAEFQLGNSGSAADYINVIRVRAAKEGAEEQIKVSASDIDIDFLLEERAREFCGEGIRWFDLKRTGKLVDYVKAYNKGPASDYIKDYHFNRPIPSEELDALLNRDEFVDGLTGYNY